MAKISISLPDELAEQLDSYAEQTGFKRSAAVAHVLENFFTDHSHKPQQISQEQIEHFEEELDEIQSYLRQLHELKPDTFPRPSWVERAPRRGLSRTLSRSLGMSLRKEMDEEVERR